MFFHYVFSNVSQLWNYFDLQGHWTVGDLKKYLYTLQADPEKSWDFIFKYPGIFINWKSRDSPDPARAWLPSIFTEDVIESTKKGSSVESFRFGWSTILRLSPEIGTWAIAVLWNRLCLKVHTTDHHGYKHSANCTILGDFFFLSISESFNSCWNFLEFWMSAFSKIWSTVSIADSIPAFPFFHLTFSTIQKHFYPSALFHHANLYFIFGIIDKMIIQIYFINSNSSKHFRV